MIGFGKMTERDGRDVTPSGAFLLGLNFITGCSMHECVEAIPVSPPTLVID